MWTFFGAWYTIGEGPHSSHSRCAKKRQRGLSEPRNNSSSCHFKSEVRASLVLRTSHEDLCPGLGLRTFSADLCRCLHSTVDVESDQWVNQ